MCVEAGLPKRKFSLDTPIRWNSSYKQLTQAIQYGEILGYLYKNRINDPTTMITDAHWSLAILVHKILVVYDRATKIFCYVYQPNIHLVLLECIKIVHEITKNMSVDVLKDVLQDMMEKWLSQFENIPSIYGVACIIDPAVRVEGLRKLLQFYYVSLNRPTYNVDGYIESCKRTLHDFYNYFASIYNSGTSSNNAPCKGVQIYDPFISNILNSQNRFATSFSSTRQSMEVDDICVINLNFKKITKSQNGGDKIR